MAKVINPPPKPAPGVLEQYVALLEKFLGLLKASKVPAPQHGGLLQGFLQYLLSGGSDGNGQD